MTINQLIYLSLLTISLVTSFYGGRHSTSLRIFPYLLSLSLGTEVLVMVFYYILDLNYNIIYHVYIPLEYSILGYFFYMSIPRPFMKKCILVSIPLFIAVSLIISSVVLTQSVEGHPGLNFNLEGLLLILWCIVSLLTVAPVPNAPLFKLPIFWICIGILIFHTGIFLFNGVYNYLTEINLPAAERLNQLIIKNLNYILYICFTIAFICSIRMRKYTLL